MFAEFCASLLHSRQDFFARYSLSSVKLIQAGLNFRSNFAQVVVFFEKTKTLANHFAGRLERPLSTLRATRFSNSGVKDTFINLFRANYSLILPK